MDDDDSDGEDSQMIDVDEPEDDSIHHPEGSQSEPGTIDVHVKNGKGSNLDQK